MAEPETVILANGIFPTQTAPLRVLTSANYIICCDGATENLLDYGLEPDVIIGDMDSLSGKYQRQFKDRIVKIERQTDTDLAKALKWCVTKKLSQVTIVGATGLREDHTLGNIFLLFDYAAKFDISMYTDAGLFLPVTSATELPGIPGQQISLFSHDPTIRVSSNGLKYPLLKSTFPTLHAGILNECLGDSFHLEISHGTLLVFIKYEIEEECS
ncbi:MAG: thiamine diphosphokinase [FCB group bacterium]|nr:thiamine diphosphokinase [FCB group bacterium]